MHYQIFIPTDAPKAPQQLLIDVGLSDHIAGHEPRSNSQGPEEKMGTLFAWRKPGANQKFHFNANEQTWIPAVQQGESPAGRYWVGFWNDSPVTPEDVQRSYSHPGRLLELGDGNNWRFPILNELPKDLILADDGSWKFQIQRDYHDLWLAGMDWLQKIFETTTHDFCELADFVVKCLRQNYHIVPELVSKLSLFNTINISAAIAAILELETASS